MSNTNSGTEPVERFASRAFADDVERLDAPTRARLAAARRRAIESISTDRRPVLFRLGGPAWAVAGCAAALVVALALVPGPGDDGTVETDAPLAVRDGDRNDGAAPYAASDERIEALGGSDAFFSLADLELLVGSDPDVLDVLEEDLEFYAWLEQQPELAMSGGARER